jgi:ElaB/YqjD/DUF883 family membrane-anchored ribosome-binding protein
MKERAIMANTTTKSKTEDRLQQAGEAVSQTAQKVAEGRVGEVADDAASAAGSGLTSMSEGIKKHGPQEGMLGQAASTVASGLESAGKYLQEQGVSGAAEDLTNLIRRHPVPAVLIAAGIGFLVAQLTSSRR